jgi:DNA-binding NarL/FixJ family response regulator
MALNKHEPATKKARIFLVDDHPIVRQGMKELIEQEPDLTVCGEADNHLHALRGIAAAKPDGAIVDISLNKDMGGLELIKDLKVQFPDLPVLVLSFHDENVLAERALRAGAKGYVMKEQATEKVLIAIRRILKGEIYLSERLASRMLSQVVDRGSRTAPPATSVDLLTDRELEVFQMIGRGLGTRRIAEDLHLSIKTIEAYRMHIRDKLKLKNGTELLQHAIQWVQDVNKR